VINEKSIETEFGSLIVKINIEGNQLEVYRELVVKSGKYEASEYSAFQKFIASVKKRERSKLVLINKT